ALIDLDIDSFSIVLVHPSDSVVAHVYLYNPGDPSAEVDVNLEVSPSGRSVVNTPEIAMHHDDWATVTIYPQAVNQEVDDVLVKALVNGLETSRLELTNAGIVLPERVRGPNTPEGMIDRISEGTGNWGSFYGVASVAPNLQGIHGVYFQIQRPEDD